jgi:hypothetical protein
LICSVALLAGLWCAPETHIRNARSLAFAYYLIICLSSPVQRKSYLEARLAKSKRDALDDEEVEEEVPPDHELYDDQLTQIACLARLVAPSITVHVAGMSATGVAALTAQVSAAELDEENWATCCEQVHWIVLFSGFLLADSDVDEAETVPPEIMAYSASLPADAGAAGDAVVGLSSTLLGLLAAMSATAGTPQAERVSPAVLGNLLWWATRWAKAYVVAIVRG